MRIRNLWSVEPGDVEARLIRLASGDDCLAARKAQMLLELVRRLQAQEAGPRTSGCYFPGELLLTSADPADRVSVRILVDWQDYGPQRDGLPVMHYRLQFRRAGAKLSTDARAQSLEDVERIVWEAFGWGR
jgi:hypothetical protein